MLPDGRCLINILTYGGNIRLGDYSKTVPIQGKGNTHIDNIRDVLYVPSLSIGLLSVSQFDLLGFVTVFAHGRVCVYSPCNDLLLTGTLIDNLYYMDSEYVDKLYGSYAPVTKLTPMGGAVYSCNSFQRENR
jgi:hypothetical protein